jgi:hypothetical protein
MSNKNNTVEDMDEPDDGLAICVIAVAVVVMCALGMFAALGLAVFG